MDVNEGFVLCARRFEALEARVAALEQRQVLVPRHADLDQLIAYLGQLAYNTRGRIRGEEKRLERSSRKAAVRQRIASANKHLQDLEMWAKLLEDLKQKVSHEQDHSVQAAAPPAAEGV